MTFELAGKVKLVQEAQTFDSGFTKREVVLTVTDGKWPQEINFEFLQDKVSLLDAISEGQEIKVFFDIRGREFKGKYFNNLVGWKIESISNAAVEPTPAQPSSPEQPAKKTEEPDYPPSWDNDDEEESPFG